MATKNLPLGTAVGTGTLMLPQFAPGMLLQSDDLSALGAYSRDLSRLLFRTLFGCGVICGLKVTTLWKCDKLTVTIDPGVALDCCGDPIQVTTTQHITIDSQCDPTFPKKLYVVLCEKNKCCAPRPAMCASDNGDSTPVCTREKYGFEITVVRERPDCACGCPNPDDLTADEGLLDSKCQCANPKLPCYKDHYTGVCGCDCCGSGTDCTCNCNCVLLASLNYQGGQDTTAWAVDHRVRRFVRPVLIQDPLADQAAALQAKKKEEAAALGQGPAAVAQPAEASAALALAAQVRAAEARSTEARVTEARAAETRAAELRAAEAHAAEAHAAEARAAKAHEAEAHEAEAHPARAHTPAPARGHKRTR
jgi:hypothetical protein